MSLRPLNPDVAVVGSGVVGMVTAVLLAKAGVEVLLIDPVTPVPVRDEPYDLRSLALTPASVRILTAAGIWPLLEAARVGCFKAIEIWEEHGDATVHFTPPPYAAVPLAYLVEQANLLQACQRALALHAHIADVGCQVTALAMETTHANLRLSDGRKVRAAAVLACDGAGSPLRKMAGIACDIHDYQQHAVIANVDTEQPHAEVARQRFLDNGPLALLPLPPAHLSAIVWTMTPQEAQACMTETDDAFRARLERASGQRLGAVNTTTRRLAFPLRRQQAATYAQERLALLGDAAHVVHPLAGQGLNLGLLDAAAMHESLLARRIALGHPQSALQRYARIRRAAACPMLALTHELNRAFRNTWPGIVNLRQQGLRLAERCTPLKRFMMEHAMGERGDLPTLARMGID